MIQDIKTEYYLKKCMTTTIPISTKLPHLDVLPSLAPVHPVLDVEPEVSGQVVHEASARSDDVAVPCRFRLRGHLPSSSSSFFIFFFPFKKVSSILSRILVKILVSQSGA